MEQINNKSDVFFYREEKYLIDKETGKKYPRSRFDTIPETRDYKKMRPNEVKNEHLQGGFFQLITEFGTNLIKRYDVSFEDLGKLAVLFTYTGYRNAENEKMYIKYGNNKYYADNKKLQEILKLNAEQVRNFKKRVSKKGILNQDEKGMYFTDDLVIRGHLFPVERKSMSYIRVYDEPIRDLYNLIVTEGQSKTSKGVGVLLALLPFMQKNKNVLSSVYYDEAEQRYRPMSNIQVAEALGIDRHVLSRNITTMNNQLIKKVGEPLIYDVTVKPFGIKDERYKKSGLVINPKYSYSSTTSDYEQLISEIERMVITLPEIKM
jgi:hypothetical protein